MLMIISKILLSEFGLEGQSFNKKLWKHDFERFGSDVIESRLSLKKQ